MAERERSLLEEYWVDAWQRSILFLDILRERGNTYLERTEQIAPNVLKFDGDVVRDGRTLERPVNYALLRIAPLPGKPTDPKKAPFIIVDPRAGHGPGIGGMKPDSEIGVALAAGHPCYFIGFLPAPVPGQTIDDVCRAEAIFVADVAARHPEAEGKPAIIANCQAGWQVRMMAAVNPDLTGPIVLAGSPLSYWAGVHGKNPLRYLGGVLGGTWMTAFAGDVGGGVFDGAHLVRNFESLDPANTYWEKPYNVYSKVDTEAPRFLDFESWWGNPVLLNAEEMQWIADNLFVGNKLSVGRLLTSEGVRIDLRNIKAPIVVFCSHGDNITPPQQALGWITDIYEDADEIVANGQTIVYCLHQTIGHLGIFVSGKVATREHSEFVSCMEMIDLMPPGLYEAVITEVAPDTKNPELIEGRYLFTLQPRTLDHIRALGGNSADDNLCFLAAARVSEVNRSLYSAFGQPLVENLMTAPLAEASRRLHPNRLRFALFSNENPAMAMIERMAVRVREDREPVSADNPLLAVEKQVSSWISSSLQAYGELRDAMVEAMFLTTYGSPWLRAAVGIDEVAPTQRRRIERDLIREAREAQQRLELEPRFESGSAAEAVIRALLHVRGPEGGVDERAFIALRELRAVSPAGEVRTAAQLKPLLRDQVLLLRLDPERAVKGIAKLLPRTAQDRKAMLAALHKMLDARRRPLTEEGKRRLEHIEALFAAKAVKPRTGAAHAAKRHHRRRERTREVSAPH